MKKCFILGLTPLLSAGAFAQQFANLGTSVFAFGASNGGGVVTGSIGDDTFIWTPSGGLTTIGSGISDGGAPRISNNGSSIGSTHVNSNTGLTEISRYDVGSGTWTNLGSLGASSGTSASSGWGVSGDGSTYVGLGWISAGSAHAIQWTQSGGLIDLGSTVPGANSRANAVNYDGSVVVGWQDTDTGFSQAAVWNHGVQSLLTTASGDPLNQAQAVSEDGTWVVGDGGFSNDFQAWRWSAATGAQSLGSIFDFDWSGSATGISGDGSKIVGYYRPFGPPTGGAGFIWTETAGMVNLDDFAAAHGIDTQGITLSLPLGISADGNTIVGIGQKDFNRIGWVMTVPEPGSMAVLGLGALAMLRRRRSKKA